MGIIRKSASADKRIPDAMEQISRRIGPETQGHRLDHFLVTLDGRVSRADVQRQIRDGRVSVGGVPVLQPSRHLRLGEQVCWEQRVSQTLSPAPLPLDIVYEDDEVLAVNKPAGLVVHPGAGTVGRTTLVEGLLATRALPASDDPARPGIVHRIDKETTGILVVAKTPRALVSLKHQFADRVVEKLYVAMVKGSFSESEGCIDAPVGRDPRAPRRMAVRLDGRAAETEFRVLQRQPGRSLVLVRPRTGRTHQIRVHFTYIGHPVVGDALYGGPPNADMLLHAWKLTILHPATGAPLTFEAPAPATFPWDTYGVDLFSERAAR
jgi:23S rRNA pseudouridine1911/1915/1917 synthase